MKAMVFNNFTLIYLPTIGLLIFASIFIGACLWILRKDSKELYDKLEQLPFNEEQL